MKKPKPRIVAGVLTVVGATIGGGKAGNMFEGDWGRTLFGKEREAYERLRTGQQEGRREGARTVQKRARERHAEWQTIADEIWDIDPDLKARPVATSIKRRTRAKESIDTIRKVIRRR
jgi:hypothetical protein